MKYFVDGAIPLEVVKRVRSLEYVHFDELEAESEEDALNKVWEIIEQRHQDALSVEVLEEPSFIIYSMEQLHSTRRISTLITDMPEDTRE